MRHPWIDCSQAPIYVVRFPVHGSLEEVEDWIGVIDRFYATNTLPFGWLVSLASLQSAYPKQRKAIAEHHLRNREHIQRYCFGIAYVVANAVMRGTITAFLWIAPPVYPFVVCGDTVEGMQWLEQRRRRSPSS